MSKNKEAVVTETAVTEAQTQAVVSAEATALADWGTNDASSRDIIIPKILAMQGLSELVTDGKAKIGDFVDSVMGDVLGSIDNPLEFIPFHMEKVWIISTRKKGESKYEFDRYEQVTVMNQNYPFEETVGDIETKYEYTLQFYVLLAKDTSMPYVLSFKSTSARAGKVLSTQMFVRNKAQGLVPPAVTMKLTGKKEKNDKGTFVVMEVLPSKATPPELIKECLTWYKVIAAGKTKVAAEKSEASSAAYADENVKF